MLRCRDEWNQLNDNKGTISVEFLSASDEAAIPARRASE
jgi:hypothetical protein